MPNRCCVVGCRSNHFGAFDDKTYLSVYRFPKDETLKKIWEKRIGAEFISKTSHRICEIHFKDKYKRSNSSNTRIVLTKDAVPSIKLPTGNFDDDKPMIKIK